MGVCEKFYKGLKKNILKIDLFFWLWILAFCIGNSLYFQFADELDNILGGILINKGVFPYTGFFSQHNVFPYLLSAAISYFTGANFILFRLFFALLLFVALLMIHLLINKYVGGKTGKYFAFLVVISAPYVWGHLFLAETIIAYASSVLTILFLFKYLDNQQARIKHGDVILVSFLCAICVMSSIAYTYYSIFIFAVFILLYFFQKKGNQTDVSWPFFVSVIFLPYLLFLAFIISFSDVKEFFFQVYTFNVEYYSQFVYVPPSPLNGLIRVVSAFFIPFSKVFLNLANIKILPALLAVTVFIAMLLYFALNKKYKSFFFFLFSLILLAPRHALNITFSSDFHRIPIFFICLLLSSISVHLYYNLSKKRRDPVSKSIFAILLILNILVVPFFISFQAKDIYYSYFRKTKSPINNDHYYGSLLNDLTEKKDFVWAAPLHFKSQINLKPRIASKYTYFLPWNSVFDEGVNELLADLEKNKPKIIIFEKTVTIWRYPVTEYGKTIIEYINRHYYQIDSDRPQFDSLYFHNSFDKTELISKLIQHNYYPSRNIISFSIAHEYHIKGGIQKKTSISQSFVSQRDDLKGINLYISTYIKKIKTPYRLILFNQNCSVSIREVDLQIDQIKDNAFFPIMFTPVKDAKNKTFCFSIEPVVDEVKTPITLWLGKHTNKLVGESVVNGRKRKDEAFLFQLIY